MSIQHYYGLCQRCKGKAVEIRTRDGRVHRGIIRHVDHQKVFIQPIGRPRSLGGFGQGFYGPGYGYGGYGYGGYGYGIALGAIAALALLPFFWW